MAYGDGICEGCGKVRYLVRQGFRWICLPCKRATR